MRENKKSVDDVIEAYESLKGIIAKEVTWDTIKEMSPSEFRAMTACMKFSDALMRLVVEQNVLLHELREKTDRIEGLLRQIDSKIEKPV